MTDRAVVESACDCKRRVSRRCLDMCSHLEGDTHYLDICANACWDSVAYTCGWWRRIERWIRWPLVLS
jgi:hypothetical protein